MNWLDKAVDAAGSFRLCKAIYIPDYSRQIDRYRCDSHGWGPVAINWSQEGDMFGTESLNTLTNLSNYEVVIDAAPYFYIIYNQYAEVNSGHYAVSERLERLAWDERPETMAPTLPLLFRMMIEWDYVFHGPFYNDEPAARLSHEAIDILGLTATVRNHFLNTCSDMPIARYLKDDPNAKDYPVDSSTTKSIENYLNKILTDFSQRPANPDLWTRTVQMPEPGHLEFS